MAGVILTHDRADFDALASCIAAHRLFPDCRIYLNAQMPGPVKEYLSLHQQFFPISISEKIPEPVDSLILVDVQNPRSLGRYRDFVEQSKGITTRIFDHHPEDQECVPAEEKHIIALGATISILIPLLQRMQISISPLEATLFALGLYADTGFLTFPQTTTEDFQSATYLYQQGADLSQVRFYLLQAMAGEIPEQVESVLPSRETYLVKGNRVMLFQAEEAKSDMSILVSRLQELTGATTLFLLAQSGENVLIVGRTGDNSLDLSEAFRRLGGGGHPYAGSARLKNCSVHSAKFLLLKTLEETLLPAATAWEIMSYPVEGILQSQPISEASHKMVQSGHSGLLVWDEQGNPVGVLTRKDVDRARKMKISLISVSQVMSSPIISVSPDTSLADIREIFAQRDIGRVIVMDEMQTPIGIVTRTDLVKAKSKRRGGISLASYLKEVLTAEQLNLLQTIGQVAQDMGVKCALVGGSVRDLVLMRQVKDWDFLVEGDAVSFASEVARVLSGELVSFTQFQTAKVQVSEFLMDFVTARSEQYPAVAELPRVAPAPIFQDLLRRDFTINAVAILLNPSEFGELMDPVKGWQDLETRTLKILHNLSFVEDPTRIFRILRYKVRFDFRIEPNTERLLTRAISARLLRRLSADRLRNELFHCLEELQPGNVLKELQNFKVLPSLFARYRFPLALFEPEDLIGQALREISDSEASAVISYFLAIGSELPAGERLKFYALFRPDSKLQKACVWLARMEQLWQKILTVRRYSALYFLLKPIPVEVQVVLWAKYPEIRQKIFRYLKDLRLLRLWITGDDLIEKGFPQGPKIGWVLQQVLRLRLDDQIQPEEELGTAIRLLRGKK